MLNDSLQELNAIKNVLAGLVNGVAALVFVFAAEPAWEAVGLIAVGATVGGALGAKVARRLPPACSAAWWWSSAWPRSCSWWSRW